MSRIPHAVILVACLLLLGSGDPPPVENTPPAKDVRPIEDDRVHVLIEITDSTSTHGYVEYDDDGIIVIRWGGKIESFLKSRILRIVPLMDVGEGVAGAVILTDGSYREGLLVEDAWDHVTVDVAGVRSRFERAVVDRVLISPSIEELYAQMKAMIEPGMYVRRLLLSEWLFQRRRYDLAVVELEALLKDQPDYTEARQLLKVTRAQLVLMKPPDGGPDPVVPPGGEAPADPRTGPVSQKDLLPSELITHEDVNLIRVYEIDFRDPPKVKVSPELIREMITTYAAHPAIPAASADRTAMFRAEPIELVRILMQDLRARDLYPKIEVLTEPRSLNLFRQRVHNRWLMNKCATNRCHGGVKAGRLFLHLRNFRNIRVRYTNMLILERLETTSGQPLINFEEPAMSLIIQYGLPRTLARFPHPQARGWSAVFSKSNQQVLDDALEWIGSMYQPRPEYPVDYTPPDLKTADAGGGVERDPGRTP